MTIQDLFDLGAVAVIENATRTIYSRGGGATMVAKGATGDNLSEYNRGTGKWNQPITPVKVPLDGSFQSQRTNFWNSSHTAARGITQFESGSITTSAAGSLDSDHVTSWPANTCQVINAGGGFLGCGQSGGSSTTQTAVLSFFIRKSDRSAVTVSDVYVYYADDGLWTNANQAGSTTYEAFGSGGWYKIWAAVPARSSTAARMQGVKVAAGLTVLLEMPQHERYTTSSPGPTDFIPTDSTTDRVREQVVLEVFLHGGTSVGPHFAEGSVAVALCPDRAAVDQTFGSVFQFGDDGDKHELQLSTTADRLQYNVTVGGVSQGTITADTLGSFAAHAKIGVCVMWGQNGSVIESHLSVNGVDEGVDTTGSYPADASARIFVGGRLDGGDVASNPANARILYVAIFDRKVSRAASALISKWMQERAEEFYPWS